MLKRFIPIFDWLPNYRSDYLRGDLSAGLTVGVMLIPQGMAYAMIAGLPPVYGLYASIVPQLIYAILGTSRQLSVAPVAMDSLLVATGVSVLAVEGTDAYISFAILLAFFMGAFQFLLGVFRLGFITNLLSRPVISGFTSAAAFIIGLNQLKHLLGIELTKSSQAFEILQSLFSEISKTHLLTFGLGVVGILIIKYAKKVHPSFPGALVAVVAGTLLVYLFQFENVSIVRGIPEGFPQFIVPNLTLDSFQQLAPFAMTIAVIAYMEAFSVAKAIETQRRDHTIRPSHELVALGAANIV
ncbi:MAG: SulP family inorganic anion transporter, partial [Cyclobacteriaceae bacterium]